MVTYPAAIKWDRFLVFLEPTTSTTCLVRLHTQHVYPRGAASRRNGSLQPVMEANDS